ncbi:hypothetical protein F0562_010883 [Nyssa sinensis]|uniref:Pentacotripeptide-repeat region of PRORP domain-containing protein n=1 Tax=Nyssa sinensis TaxID=561372 RepID=A0A5J5A1X8_9ASTE|nr:hypothetical protein F0562_010883 [Nyssa sinensis]
MMLHTCGSRDIGHENFQNSVQNYIFSSPCKLQTLHSSFKTRVFLGYNRYNLHGLVKRQDSYLHSISPSFETEQIPERIVDLHPQKLYPGVTRVYFGFKPQCHSRTLVCPTKTTINGKKKRYGGVLPSILRSLEKEDDIEKTLNLYYEKLSPKEQTVILKEQRSWERVVKVFEWMKSQKEYLPNVIHYNVVLRALGRARKWDELRLCWIEMAKKGVLPTNNTYGMLVDVYGKAGLVKEALLWIRHMRLRRIEPDEVTMNTVVPGIKGCRGTGGRQPSSKVLVSSDMESSVRKPRLTATYNTLIDLYGKAGRLKDAADVFAEMLKSGVAVDTITFNTMIFTCGSHGHLSEAESLLGKMEERGISPDTKTYNIFLSLYADAGNIDAALQCYRKIREVGLFPDVVTHRAVLQTLSQRNMVQEVETVIDEIGKSGMSIDEHSLPVIIKMYVNEGLLEQAKVLFEKGQLDGGLSSRTYAAVIDTYAEKGLWAEAEGVFFRKRDFVGQKKDVVEYNVMIKAYGKAKLYDKAFSLFKGMKNHGTWPDQCTYNSLIQMLSGSDQVMPV